MHCKRHRHIRCAASRRSRPETRRCGRTSRLTVCQTGSGRTFVIVLYKRVIHPTRLATPIFVQLDSHGPTFVQLDSLCHVSHKFWPQALAAGAEGPPPDHPVYIITGLTVISTTYVSNNHNTSLIVLTHL